MTKAQNHALLLEGARGAAEFERALRIARNEAVAEEFGDDGSVETLEALEFSDGSRLTVNVQARTASAGNPELESLRSEAARQAAIADALREDLRAANAAAAAVADQESVEAAIAIARAGGVRHALDEAIEQMRQAMSAARDLEDPEGLRSEA